MKIEAIMKQELALESLLYTVLEMIADADDEDTLRPAHVFGVIADYYRDLEPGPNDDAAQQWQDIADLGLTVAETRDRTRGTIARVAAGRLRIDLADVDDPAD